jgi:hypothetical protein
MNSFSQFQKHNNIVVSNNPTTYPYELNDQHHSYRQKPGDFCPACYSYDTKEISKRYFKTLRNELVSDVMMKLDNSCYNFVDT